MALQPYTKIVYCTTIGDPGSPGGIPDADTCYKGVFVGGERGYGLIGNLASTINIKSAANSTLYGGVYPYGVVSLMSCSDQWTLITAGEIGLNSKIITQTEIVSETEFTSFGTLLHGKQNGSSCSDNTTGLFVGGNDDYYGFSYLSLRTVEQILFATGGEATQFGTMSEDHSRGTADSDGTIVVFGAQPQGYTDYIQYDQIAHATGGASTQFGSLEWRRKSGTSVNNGTQIILWSGYLLNGYNWELTTRAEEFFFATGGIGQIFGNLTQKRELAQSCSDGVTGVLGTGLDDGYGGGNINRYESVEFQSGNDTSTFGDLTIWESQIGASSAAGYCSPADPPIPPTLGCEDTVVFDLYTYITFDKLDFHSNMDDVLLFMGNNNNAVDLQVKHVYTNDKLDPSITNIRSLELTDVIFNTSKLTNYKNVNNIKMTGLTFNTDDRNDIDDKVCIIESSEADIIDMDINIEMDNLDESGKRITGLIVNNSFVKDMNVNVITSYYGEPPAPSLPVALIAGGNWITTIEKMVFATGSTSTEFGNTSHNISSDFVYINPDCFSDRTTAFWCGGSVVQSSVFATEADTSYVGDLLLLSEGDEYVTCAFNSVFGARSGSFNYGQEDITRFTMATGGNMSLWSEMYQRVKNHAGAGNETDILWAGGSTDSYGDTADIQHQLWANSSMSTYWGGLLESARGIRGTSNDVMALWAGGELYGGEGMSDYISKSVFSSSSNATFFSNLTGGQSQQLAACSDLVTAVFNGGNNWNTSIMSAQSVEFATEADATIFGTLIYERWNSGACTGL